MKIQNLCRKWQAPLYLACGFLPVGLLTCAFTNAEMLPQTLVLFALYAVLAELCLMISGKKRVAAGVIGCALLAAAARLSFPIRQADAMLLIPALCMGLLMGGLRMASWEEGHEIHPAVGAVALTAHLTAQALTAFGDPRKFLPIQTPLTASFVGFAILAALSMNRESLFDAVNGRQKVPETMRRKNVVLTLGMSALVLAAASLPAIARGLRQLGQLVMRALGWLFSQFRRLLPEVGGSGGGTGGGLDLSGIEVREPSLFSQIMEKIAIGLALLAAAILLVLLLRFMAKQLRVLLHFLRNRWNRFMAASSEDYVDEVEDTREKGRRGTFIRAVHRRMPKKRVDERTLSPAGKIRYRYRMAGLKHPEWTQERTARENLSADAAEIYERARYSDHPVTQRDAERFDEKIGER